MKTCPYPKLENAWFAVSLDVRREIAEDMGTSVKYLRHVVKGRKRLSLVRALSLIKAFPEAELAVEDLPVAVSDMDHWGDLRAHLIAPSKPSG